MIFLIFENAFKEWISNPPGSMLFVLMLAATTALVSAGLTKLLVDTEEIARKQEELREPKQTNISTATLTEEMNQAQVELLKKREIPMLCAKHGWVHSEHYILTVKEIPLTGEKATTVNGKCPKCGHGVKRYLPPSMMATDFGMTVVLIIPLLASQGRLEDRR